VSVTLAGDRVQASPVGGEVVKESCTAPANSWRPVVVIIEVPVTPARIETFVGFAITEKSWTVYDTEAE